VKIREQHDRRRCKKIFALLSEYLDRKLPARNCQQIKKHLGGCAPCRAFLESLESTVTLCRRYRGEPLDPRAAARTRRLLLAACRQAGVVNNNAVPGIPPRPARRTFRRLTKGKHRRDKVGIFSG